jgi:hypothetical protein
MNTSTKQLSVLAALTLGLPLMVAVPALAKGGGDAVRESGACSNGSTTWELKAKPDSGVIEVEFEVDSNRVGQTWKVRLRDNGTRFFAGTRETAGASGSFTVHKNAADYAGTDVIAARAVHGSQVCHGSVTV